MVKLFYQHEQTKHQGQRPMSKANRAFLDSADKKGMPQSVKHAF